MTYINSVFASSPTYSVNRKLDIKSGIIELNKIKIRVNEGDNLQRICNKINRKTSLHGVTAKLVRERGHSVISLSSSRQIDIFDRNNILNNISTRIRANVARNSLVDGLISTSLAECKKPSPRYIVLPCQVCKEATNTGPVEKDKVNQLPAVSAEKEIVFNNKEFKGKNNMFFACYNMLLPNMHGIKNYQKALGLQNITNHQKAESQSHEAEPLLKRKTQEQIQKEFYANISFEKRIF